MKRNQQINNQMMKQGKKWMIKEKKNSQIKFWFKEFKRKSKNNNHFKYKEKFKNVNTF